MKLLFVCLGNICRSPTAEGIMQKYLADAGLDQSVFCDSAGTSGNHTSEHADSRMMKHAQERGYELLSLARQFTPQDFENFDYILTMDDSNFRNVLVLANKDQAKNKVHRMTDFCHIHEVDHVPDPYYGGDRGFQLVIDILEDACQGLLNHIKKDLQSNKNEV